MGLHCKNCGIEHKDVENLYCKRCAWYKLVEMEKVGYLQDVTVEPYFSDERGREGVLFGYRV